MSFVQQRRQLLKLASTMAATKAVLAQGQSWEGQLWLSPWRH
jgi:hypothetical protein